MLPVQTMRHYWPEPRPLVINLTVVFLAVAMGVLARIWLEKAERLIRMPGTLGLATQIAISNVIKRRFKSQH